MTDNLLIKYLTRECSEEEIRQVESWIDASVDHKEQYERLKKLWQITGEAPEFNADIAWNKFSDRLEEEEKPKQGLLRNINQRFVYLAAAASLILAVFLVTRQFFSPTEKLQASAEANIETRLADGSLVVVQAGSFIKYPRSFKKGKRIVELSGQAFFDVERDPSKAFLVRTSKGEVEVLGTSFNLREQGDSLFLTVTEGAVALRGIEQRDSIEDQEFTAGQQGVLDYKSGKIFRTVHMTEDALFWYNQSLDFTRTPLPEVLEILERNYQVKFKFKPEQLSDCLLTTKFQSESIEAILLVIESTFNIRIIDDKNSYKVLANERICKDS